MCLDTWLLTKVVHVGAQAFGLKRCTQVTCTLLVQLKASFKPSASGTKQLVAFNLSRLADLELLPWEFGIAALHNKLVTHPLAFGVGAALPPFFDVEAIKSCP